ncbi:MAG: VWA domain-containing protein, partial [Thermoplasmata archaeon]
MDVVRKAFVACVLVLSTVLVPSMLSEGTQEPPVVLSESYMVRIIDAYAVTDVERVLYNPGESSIDHTFRFVIPEGALISNFSIKVRGVTYYADVLEREEAEREYQEAVSEGRNAGLVAAVGSQTFAYKVSLTAKEEMTATIRYEQVLLKANGWHTYWLPIVNGTEPYEVGSLHVDIYVDSATEIKEMKTDGYDEDLSIVGPTSDKARISLDAKDLTPDDDLEVRWRSIGAQEEGKMYFGEKDGMGYFVHVFDPDIDIFGDARVPKDFIFILDKSGSMGDLKFSQATTALHHIYGGLAGDDRFSFVEFNGHSYVYSPKLKRANEENVKDVKAHIDRLSSGGSTNIHAGVIDALDIFKEAGDTVPIIVLLSDGRANTGLYHRSTFRQDVMQKNTVDSSIYCIALGNGADWTFLEALALENDGRAIWVLEHEDVVTEISDFVDSFSSPLLAQLSFDYGPMVTDVHPSRVAAH